MRVDIFDTQNTYNLILADPPWKQAKGGKKSVRPVSSGTELDYPACSLDEIKEHLRQATSLTAGGGKTRYYSYGLSTNICLRHKG